MTERSRSPIVALGRDTWEFHPVVVANKTTYPAWSKARIHNGGVGTLNIYTAILGIDRRWGAAAALAISVLLGAVLSTSVVDAGGPIERSIPFRGEYSAEWNFTAVPFGTAWEDGEITATHLGRGSHSGFFELAFDSSGCLFGVDSGFTWVAANGDELHLIADTSRSSACPIPGDPTALDVDIVYLVVGGTGRFAGASGEIVVGAGPTILPDGINPGTFSAPLSGHLVLPTS